MEQVLKTIPQMMDQVSKAYQKKEPVRRLATITAPYRVTASFTDDFLTSMYTGNQWDPHHGFYSHAIDTDLAYLMDVSTSQGGRQATVKTLHIGSDYGLPTVYGLYEMKKEYDRSKGKEIWKLYRWSFEKGFGPKTQKNFTPSDLIRYYRLYSGLSLRHVSTRTLASGETVYEMQAPQWAAPSKISAHDGRMLIGF